MTRLERALWIRDRILNWPNIDWTPGAMIGEGRTLRQPNFVAYHWAHDAYGNRPDFRQLPHVATDQASEFLNVIDIYVSEFPNKAFALDWFKDRPPHLRSMKRGSWESAYFGLPQYVARRKSIRRFRTPKSIVDLMTRIQKSS